jgi:hypothetical protein
MARPRLTHSRSRVAGTPVCTRGPLAGHTLRFAAALAGQGAPIPAIIHS